MTLWGGRYEPGTGGADPLFRQLNDSLHIDHRLAQQDIAGSIAWAGALRRAGVISQDEESALVNALKDLADAVQQDPDLVLRSACEDVHSWVESELITRLGPLGKKLHTGRSRNDQVATDLRMWTLQQLDERIHEIRGVQRALLRLAEREQRTIFPGYTHLQRAQPIVFAHWCLAYWEMLQRDIGRCADAVARASECPLGCGALAGAAYSIDREALADVLGFARPCSNSLDAVSDRDFVIESLAALSLLALHLSRLAEDLIIYSSAEFAYVELPDAFTSGSSLMPQKKNPDALELIRAKTGRIIASHVNLCITLKGLALAYNKDLQEDKQPLFDSMEQASLMLRVLPPLLEGMKINRDLARSAASGGHANATELADYLVSKGVPFRDAHETAGRIVRMAIDQSVNLEDLSIDQFRSISAHIDDDVYAWMTPETAVQRRDALGGTSFRQVQAAIKRCTAAMNAADDSDLSRAQHQDH